MADLIAKSACEGLLPITVEPFRLVEEDLGVLTSIAPFAGQGKALDKALNKAHGVSLPPVNRRVGKGDIHVIWFGRDQYLMAGAVADSALRAHAALTDQSDAWASVRLEGERAEDVLARLVPVDLRASVFKRGHTVRSDLKHMMASITRTGANSFSVMVFRSMASTLVHDLKTAMEAVAARR